MRLTTSDVGWILDRRVTGETLPEQEMSDCARVTDGNREMVLSYDGERLLFNGRFVNVGDNLAEFLAVMDEIEQQGWSEPEGDE